MNSFEKINRDAVRGGYLLPAGFWVCSWAWISNPPKRTKSGFRFGGTSQSWCRSGPHKLIRKSVSTSKRGPQTKSTCR